MPVCVGIVKQANSFLVRAIRHVVALGRRTVSPNMFSACFYDCFRLVKMYVDIGSGVLAWCLGDVCVCVVLFLLETCQDSLSRLGRIKVVERKLGK